MKQSNTWLELERGDAVQLQTDDQLYRQAIVDDFSADRMVVWVRMMDLNERKIVLYEDGVGITPARCPAPQPAGPL